MFSQSTIDSMSIDELTKLIRSTALEVCNRTDDAEDAIDYCYALINLTHNLKNRLNAYAED